MMIQEKDKLEILKERLDLLTNLLLRAKSNDTILFEYYYSTPPFPDEFIIRGNELKVYEIKKMDIEKITKNLMQGERLNIKNLSLEKRIKLESQDDLEMN